MEEIQINEFIRTDDGHIFQVIDVEKNAVKIQEKYYREWISLCCIKKHSKNIIDLIEKDDFVNGIKIYYIEHSKNSITKQDCIRINKFYTNAKVFYETDIKTILTHEQYENNCYRIGE